MPENLKQYVGGEFILESDDDSLRIIMNCVHGPRESFSWKALEEEGVCRRPSGWISVKERLPGFGMRVLAGSFDDVSEAFFDGSVFVITDGQLFPDIRQKLQDSVTHWQPLPSPPEVEE